VRYIDVDKNIKIIAKEIYIPDSASFGTDIDIHLKGVFSIGEHSRLGSDIHIRGNNVSFGDHLFNSKGLRIGGGGRQHPAANLTIGDRCTIHNNFINLCEPVVIGNDVGLSPDTSIITHGYWQSVLEGYPTRFAGVTIENGVIVGYRCIITMGVSIGENAVIGAGSIVTKDIPENTIAAGNPAQVLRVIKKPSHAVKSIMVEHMVDEYRKIAEYHGLDPDIEINYPYVKLNDCRIDVERMEIRGKEDEATDDFRDYIRKWGIRIFTDRPFRSKFEFYNDEV